MVWRVEFDSAAVKALRKVDRVWQERIIAHLEEIGRLDDPRMRGKALTGDLSGLWRYCVGDYRVVCHLRDEMLIVVVIRIAHRRKKYD